MTFAHTRIIVAGTFDRLHEGHHSLLHTAFAHGDHVEVWLTDDAMVQAKATRVQQHITNYRERAQAVADWCDAQTVDSIVAFFDATSPPFPPRGVCPGRGGGAAAAAAHPYAGHFSLHELHDALGDSVRDPTYTAIACSPETEAGCEEINRVRVGRGWPPLALALCPLILSRGGGGRKVSSTDLRAAGRTAE